MSFAPGKKASRELYVLDGDVAARVYAVVRVYLPPIDDVEADQCNMVKHSRSFQATH